MVSADLSNDVRAEELIVSASTDGADKLEPPFEADTKSDEDSSATSVCPWPDTEESYAGLGVRRVSVDGLEEPFDAYSQRFSQNLGYRRLTTMCDSILPLGVPIFWPYESCVCMFKLFARHLKPVR